MNRMQILTAERNAPRRAMAAQLAADILCTAQASGIAITLVGSLARSDFRLHSDIDLLVHGPADPELRLRAEQLVARHMRGHDIPYDLIFEADLTEDRVRDLLHDRL